MKCNNCNVYLAEYLDECPLCHTKIEKIDNNNAYSDHIEELSRDLNLLYFSKTIIKILILTNIICMICNLSINKTISWSLYVLFSSIYICSYALYIVLKNKLLAFVFNMFSLELLLFMIALLTHSLNWFIYFVGPYLVLFTLFVLLNIYLSKQKNILRNVACFLIFIAFCLTVINGGIKLYQKSDILLTWSIISNTPIIIISGLLMILSFNTKISNEIEKRFFV